MTTDIVTGETLKREGMQMALSFAGDWSDEVVLEFRGWIAVEKARGLKTVTIEQFRSQAKAQPRSHKCWGSAPRLFCKAGLIAPKTRDDGSQVTVKAASPKTHAHEIRVWLVR